MEKYYQNIIDCIVDKYHKKDGIINCDFCYRDYLDECYSTLDYDMCITCHNNKVKKEEEKMLKEQHRKEKEERKRVKEEEKKNDNSVDPWFRPSYVEQPISIMDDAAANTRINRDKDDDMDDNEEEHRDLASFADTRRVRFIANDDF